MRANVLAIIGLTFLLYGVMSALILRQIDVPDVLVAAASALSGALITLLVNTKPTPEVPMPVYEAEPPDAQEGAGEVRLILCIVAALFLTWLLFAWLGDPR